MRNFNGTRLKSAIVICGSILLSLTATTAGAEDLPYGSRAGMQVTVTSKSGIGTSKAVIKIKHTAKDAKAFCVGYSEDYSMACVKRTLAEIKVGDRVTGNCKKRTWVDLYGRGYAFEGKAKSTGDFMMADYAIRDLSSGELLDGTSASGYGVALVIFQALCPGVAK